MTRILPGWRPRLVAFAFLLVPSLAGAQIVVDLKDSFIEAQKNRVTIEANLTIDHAMTTPKKPSASKPSNDGDIHVAARAASIGLPIVFELMNAADARDSIKTLAAAEGTTDTVHVKGAWRLWCEHGGTSDQIQGNPVAKAANTNPDHCFEIHPATEIAGVDVSATWKEIPDFKTKDAEAAFSAYELVGLEITHNDSTQRTRLHTNGIGFNYVEFAMELTETPTFLVDDGLFVRANVYSLEGELLVRNRRMAFAKGTIPYEQVLKQKQGAFLHVLGVPRINFAILAWRVSQRTTRPEVLRWNLPYEMIITGFYEVLDWEEEN